MEKLTIEVDLEEAKWQTVRLNGYRMGLHAASQMALSYAEQCCGGSGEGGEGYRNLAYAILKIDPDKGY